MFGCSAIATVVFDLLPAAADDAGEQLVWQLLQTRGGGTELDWENRQQKSAPLSINGVFLKIKRGVLETKCLICGPWHSYSSRCMDDLMVVADRWKGGSVAGVRVSQAYWACSVLNFTHSRFYPPRSSCTKKLYLSSAKTTREQH